jgi:hypothetical protein
MCKGRWAYLISVISIHRESDNPSDESPAEKYVDDGNRADVVVFATASDDDRHEIKSEDENNEHLISRFLPTV